MMEETPKKISEKKAFSKMATLCAKREYCVFDIKTKLFRYELDVESIERIVEQLKKEKYIDELRFARSFIYDKMRFNKWGRVKIDFGLRQKRVPQAIISEAFIDFTDEQLNDSLEDVLSAKWKTIKEKTEQDKRTKLIRFALGRGFEMNHILAYIDKLR